jgi:two-component system, NarL family, response regulator LiaR
MIYKSVKPVKQNISEREKEVMSLIATGLTCKQVAEKLFLSPGTVKKHLDNIYFKLNVSNKIEAINKLKNTE